MKFLGVSRQETTDSFNFGDNLLPNARNFIICIASEDDNLIYLLVFAACWILCAVA